MSRRKNLVAKSNLLIEASYRLTLNEQRIVLFSICQCREEQKGLFPGLPVTITAETFAQQFNIDVHNAYGQLKEAMASLYERSVTFYDIDPATQNDRVNQTRWISKASYIDGSGHVQVIFTADVVEYFTRLEKEFTSYLLEKAGGLTSANAIRIYEMLLQYLSIGKRTLEIAELREKLQLTNNEYKVNADFKRSVIDLAVAQINKHTDLKISYTPKKTGRAITAFEFTIKTKLAKPKKIKPVIDDVYLAKHARPGESRDQAYQRLKKQSDQPCLDIPPP